MPSVGSSRVKTTGRGEIEYAADSNSVTTATVQQDATNTDFPILSVAGDNVGTGIGLYNGSNGLDNVVLEFKSLKAGPGIALTTDGSTILIRATGNVAGGGDGNGGVYIGDGFDIPMGNATAKGDGSWLPGAVTITDDDTVSNVIDNMNELLGLLIPAAPPNFPNGALSIINTAGLTPRLASGAISHVSGGGIPVAGDSVARITTTTVSSNTFNDVGPANNGKIQLLLNGGFVGERELTGASDNGNYGGLLIADEKAYPADKPGFWTSLDASAAGVAVAQGLNKLKMVHSNAGSTADAYFVRDDMISAPSIPTGSLSLQTLGTVAYSSGIPHFGDSGILSASASITNLSGQTYFGGNDAVTISGTGGIITSQPYSYNSLGITTPIPANTTAATPTTAVAVNVDGVTHGKGFIQAVAKNVNGQTAATNLAGTLILVKRGVAASNRIDELSVPVTGLGSTPNANYAKRVLIASTGNTPAGTPVDWVSSTALAAYEAAVWAGELTNCQTDFSVGYLPSGPNYSQGRNAPQYATFAFNRASVSTFKINIVGTYNGVWIKLPGVSDNNAISPNATNGWWDATKSYNGAGVPGNASDASAGCASGAPMTGASGAYTMTFGPQSSTNATANLILVRIRLNVGQTITSLNFSN